MKSFVDVNIGKIHQILLRNSLYKKSQLNFLIFTFVNLKGCVYVCLCGCVHLSIDTCRVQKSDFLELELQAVLSCQLWVLETELESFRKVVCILKC